MRFFTKRKEYELMEKMCDAMESSQKNNELMLKSLGKIIEIQKPKEIAGLGDFESEEQLKFEKLRAAYALNLCTVSVSQIIDYEDLVVLEQEYDMILNNLNLENIPKDEALLSILKQILDTVTFFRIQAGDRKMIEKEHQQKMKDAIWSAVPSFGMIVAGGNVWTTLVSIASQVGIGYMNYRKAKAANFLEYDKQMWQLQRSAIEQLNGLRRELFDASWRLADTYGFKDEQRLTEKQITQYNDILLDPDDLRRYERLNSISTYFDAFPPFWYHLAHAANMVYQYAKKSGDNDVATKYKEIALLNYDRFRRENKFDLLREDLINSTACLEYIDLLDSNNDGSLILIKDLLDSAVRTSGRAYDVLQLCALTYLRINDISEAVKWLRYLVNEKYNDITNAQLLSYIYAVEYFKGESTDTKINFKLLCKRVDENLLFPLPEANDKMEVLAYEFENKQKMYLIKKYAVVVEKIRIHYTIKFNQCMPAPVEGKVYKDDFYLNYAENIKDRHAQYVNQFNNDKNRDVFVERLENTNLFGDWIELFNDMLRCIEQLLIREENQEDYVDKTMITFSNHIESKFKKSESELNSLQEKMSNSFDIENFDTLFKRFSFEFFTKEVFHSLLKEIYDSILNLRNMSSITRAEIELKKFCKNNKYQDPDVMLRTLINGTTDETITTYISSDILGGAAYDKVEESRLLKRMSKVIDDKIDKCIVGENDKVIPILKFGRGKRSFHSHFVGKRYFEGYKSMLVGTIYDKSVLKNSIVFLTKGIIIEEAFTGFFTRPQVVEYCKISLESDYLNVDGKAYKNGNLDLEALYDIIQDLAAMSKPMKQHSELDEIDMLSDEIPLLEIMQEDVSDISSIGGFKLLIQKRVYRSSGKIDIYGRLIDGGEIEPGTELWLVRDGENIVKAIVESFEKDTRLHLDGANICISGVTEDIMRGDFLYYIPSDPEANE